MISSNPNPSIPPPHLRTGRPPVQHTGPLFVSSHPSLFLLLPLALSFCVSPPPGSPQLRGPGAFRPDTHTPYTRQRTQQEMPNTSFRMMPLCQLDRRLQALSPEKTRGTQSQQCSSQLIGHKKWIVIEADASFPQVGLELALDYAI